MHEPRDAGEKLDVQAARRRWREYEEYDADRRIIEGDVVRHVAHETRGDADVRDEIGAAVWNGEAPAQRRTYLGLARFNGVENARDSDLVGGAEGQTNEFAQKFGFGVAAERNAYALR
jgi:hypothetical protein